MTHAGVFEGEVRALTEYFWKIQHAQCSNERLSWINAYSSFNSFILSQLNVFLCVL